MLQHHIEYKLTLVCKVISNLIKIIVIKIIIITLITRSGNLQWTSLNINLIPMIRTIIITSWDLVFFDLLIFMNHVYFIITVRI